RAPESRGETLDAIVLLESQHRAIEEVFQRMARESIARDVRPALLQLADLLTLHSAIEERHFYPGVRTDETEALIDDSAEDHMDMKGLLLHLVDAGPDDPDFPAKLEELQGLVEAHVAEEEDDLFPRVRDTIEEDALAGLAQEMTATMV